VTPRAYERSSINALIVVLLKIFEEEFMLMSKINKFGFLLIAIASLPSCVSTSSFKSKMLFELWNDGISSCSSQAVYYQSPSGKYALVVSIPDNSTEEETRRILWLFCSQSKIKQVIGRGDRGIGVVWYSTQMGDIAEIDHSYDTHYNEIYIIAPIPVTEKGLPFKLLYKTPDIANYSKQVKIGVDHSYWRVKTISTDGNMIIDGGWDYLDFPGKHSVSKEFIVPLFYGSTSLDQQTGSKIEQVPTPIDEGARGRTGHTPTFDFEDGE
jgi:hypothetical protein